MGKKEESVKHNFITVKLKCYIMRIYTLPIKNITHEPHAHVGVHSRRRDVKTLKLCEFLIKFGNIDLSRVWSYIVLYFMV